MLMLYVGLGLAMISGISSMFKIANNINNLSSVSYFKQSEYFQTVLPKNDKKIIRFLNDYSGPFADVCPKVIVELNKLENTVYIPGESTPNSDDMFFGNSCSLVNKVQQHRVLINENQSGGFNLFSCYLKKNEDNFCSYEVDPQKRT